MTDFEKTLLVTLYWPKMKTQIEHFVKKCHPCQSTLPNKIKPPLGKFPLPDRRFSDLHLDVVGPLPESRGYKFLLTIFCRLTRYFTKRSRWPKPWLRSALRLSPWVGGQVRLATVGLLGQNGRTFVSRLWQDLQRTLNVKVIFVPYFHQATNGIVERAHGTLKRGLKAMLVEMGQNHKQDWYVH